MKRHGHRRVVMHAERASAAAATAAEALRGLQKELSKYSRKNIFNTNDFQLQFRLSQDRTIADKQFSERKIRIE